MIEKQLEQERRLYKRLVNYYYDFYDAVRYADLVLTKNLHQDKEDGKYLYRALNTALLVSYWRPFSNNRDSVNKIVWKELLDRFLKDFSIEEENLHNQIGKLRNQDFAHSDADSHHVKLNVVNYAGASLAIPISRNASIPIEQSQTEMLRRMIDKLLGRILQEIMRIQKQLPIGNNF